MAAHARTLNLDNSLFFAVSPELINWIILESFWGTKKYNISFQNSLHNIFDSKLFEEQIALGLILELEAIWPLIIFKGCPKFSFHWKWLKERWRHFYLAVILLVIISKCWFIMVVGDLLNFSFDSKTVDGQMVPLWLGSYLASNHL